MNEEKSYQDLAERLDALPNAFPSTEDGAELRLLAKLFTPEEAALAAQLRLTLETPKQLAARIGGEAVAALASAETTDRPRVERPQGPDLGAYKIYIVKRGDSFSKIARVQLGDENKAKQLFELNKSLGLAYNINIVNEGQQIVLGYK